MSDDERIERLELEVEVLRANNKGLKDKIEELNRINISNSQIIANLSTRHFNEREKIRKFEKLVDKIKAIIEELQEDIKYSANPLSIDNSKFAIKVLQSLLEKE